MMRKVLLNSGIFLFVLLFLEEIQLCLCTNSTLSWEEGEKPAKLELKQNFKDPLDRCIEDERQALLKLKRSFEDPSNWLASWSGEDCCQWRGVGCDKRTGHVIKLNLRTTSILYQDIVFSRLNPRYNLSEQLSAVKVDSCLAEFRHLEYLDLSGNNFRQSPIPKFFGSMKNLRYLNLSNANFGGTIPRQLGNLTRLRVLDLNQGRIFSQIVSDSFQWASSLVSLQHLDMSRIDLRRALDLMNVLSSLPSLRHLRLEGCGIWNDHFSRCSANSSSCLASLQFLSLRYNVLGGETLKYFHNMTALRELDLGDSYGLVTDNFRWASSLLSLQRLDMTGADLSTALDLVQVLNTLPSLVHLGLQGCGIQNTHFSRGSFNSTFSKRVQFLYLGANWLIGPVLNFLQNMTSLTELDLSRNGFNSTLPLGLVDSRSLVRLDLSWNNFDSIEGGVLSILNNACSLKYLDLSLVPLSGEVFGSEQNSSRCPKYDLEFLSLTDTIGGCTVPEWLGNLKSLRFLFLPYNSFYGPIPNSLGEISTLEELLLSSNQLSGIIPEELGRLTSLQTLDLSYNQLYGDVPNSLWRLRSLWTLDLSHNQLNGSIPETIGSLENLWSLDISVNSFQGVVTEHTFANLSNLWSLDISANSFEGVVTEHTFANLSNLNTLSIGYNRFTCKMKPSWVPPFSLYEINMSSIDFGSRFPRWIRTQKEVSKLDLSNANISGSFPPWLHLRYLKYLDLSYNRINGSFPSNLDDMPDMQVLLLKNNLINGSLSSSLCNLKMLELFDLSNNKLSGEIPDCWRYAQSLVLINLSSNKISGTIPRSLEKLRRLKWFHLNDNNLGGDIPPSLRYCTSLELLDLGENKISGAIPAWIGESLLSLKILRLRNNALNGNIPSQLCGLEQLKILDLALNGLSGGIPRCFGNLVGMTSTSNVTQKKLITQPPDVQGSDVYPPVLKVSSGILVSVTPPPPPIFPVDNETQWHKEKVWVFTKGRSMEYTTTLRLLDCLDLSMNKLNGSIPEEIVFLSGLRCLNLSHNRLSGKIPEKIGGLKVIETLDLSHNHLSGPIPPSLSAIATLNHLNLSYNDLSGKIPIGSQLQTLNDPSIYAGNLGLCGAPLPTCEDETTKPARPRTGGGEDWKEKILFWFIVASGYATGLWGVIGILVFKRSWRIAYFRFVDDAKERTLAVVAIKVARLKQRMQRTGLEAD